MRFRTCGEGLQTAFSAEMRGAAIGALTSSITVKNSPQPPLVLIAVNGQVQDARRPCVKREQRVADVGFKTFAMSQLHKLCIVQFLDFTQRGRVCEA